MPNKYLIFEFYIQTEKDFLSCFISIAISYIDILVERCSLSEVQVYPQWMYCFVEPGRSPETVMLFLSCCSGDWIRVKSVWPKEPLHGHLSVVFTIN